MKPRIAGTVVLPRTPREGMNGTPWAIEVNRCLQQLRDRFITSGKTKKGSSPHPWKVTANGDDGVKISAGSLNSYAESSYTLREFLYYDGSADDIVVTGAGAIYGRILAGLAFTSDIIYTGTDYPSGDAYVVYLNRVFPDIMGTLVFSFETTEPTSLTHIYFQIANVDLVDGKAVVTRQILTHNPTLSSWQVPP